MRIIGAEEAKTVLGSGAPDSGSHRALGDEEPTAEHPAVAFDFGSAPVETREESGPPAAHDAAESAGLETGEDAPESAPAPEGLPHWSEPATGEVPIILGDADGEALATADVGGSPRFRTGANADWTDDDLQTFDILAPASEETLTLSDLASPPEDDDLVFDRAVAARRVGTTPSNRARSTAGASSGGDADPMGLGSNSRSDMAVRVVTGLGVAGLAIVCLAAGRDVAMVLSTAVIAICTFELFQALHQRGFRPATVIAILGSLTIVPLAYDRGEFAFPFTIALVMVFTLLWFVFEVVHTRPMVNVAVTVGGFVYTGALGAFAGLLLTSENGVGLIYGVALPVMAYDIFGYLVGSWVGKSRLAPEISPNKTVEGLIGGMTGAIIVSVLIVKQIHPWGDFWEAFAGG